jgi:hypothetical protein
MARAAEWSWLNSTATRVPRHSPAFPRFFGDFVKVAILSALDSSQFRQRE